MMIKKERREDEIKKPFYFVFSIKKLFVEHMFWLVQSDVSMALWIFHGLFYKQSKKICCPCLNPCTIKRNTTRSLGVVETAVETFANSLCSLLFATVPNAPKLLIVFLCEINIEMRKCFGFIKF